MLGSRVEAVAKAVVRHLRARLGHAELVEVRVGKSKVRLVFEARGVGRVKVILSSKGVRVYSGLKGLDLSIKRVAARALGRVSGNGGQPSQGPD